MGAEITVLVIEPMTTKFSTRKELLILALRKHELKLHKNLDWLRLIEFRENWYVYGMNRLTYIYTLI